MWNYSDNSDTNADFPLNVQTVGERCSYICRVCWEYSFGLTRKLSRPSVETHSLSVIEMGLSFWPKVNNRFSLVFTVVRSNTLLLLIETRSNPEKMMGLFQTSGSRKTQLHLKMNTFSESLRMCFFYCRKSVEILRTNIFHRFS